MINGIGHFRVWRELFTKPIWLNSTLEQQVILITLMAMANFQPREWEWQGKKYNVKPGQFITSSKSIIENTGGNVTTQNVRTALARFEKLGFLTNESTKQGRLITLVNWRDYQYTDDYANQDPNRRVTKTQPRPNQDLTTREEGNKVISKETYSAFFEEVWILYPNKRGKDKISDTKKKEIYKVGEEFKRCISRYVDDVEARRRKGFSDLNFQNGSTFFNSGYVDYLDKNYSVQNDQYERVGVPPSESVLGERVETWF